jgi:hypothetical protein
MASPLTLLLPVIPGTSPVDIVADLAKYGPELDSALRSTGTVHYARTLILDRSGANLQGLKGPFVIAIVTEFDGSFDKYIGDFVSKVGNVFDALLKYVVGGKDVIPVASHVAAFGKLIAANNASQLQPALFQAYTATVQEILANLPPPAEAEPAAKNA